MPQEKGKGGKGHERLKGPNISLFRWIKTGYTVALPPPTSYLTFPFAGRIGFRMATMHSSHPGVPGQPQKLGSWKCIASYFGCDERTARRWERERGLPVHRAPGGKRSAVFAYSSELETWLRTGGQEQDSPVDIAEHGAGACNGLAAFSRGDSLPVAMVAATQIPMRADRVFRRWVIGIAAGVAMVILAAVALRIHEARIAELPEPTVRASSIAVRHVAAPDAEDLYLRGRYYWSLRTADSLSRAVDAYTQAIVKNPSYAEAYAGLAETYELLPQFGQGDLGDSLRKAKEAAERAIALNPNLADAHRARAFALFYWDWDIPGSDAEFRRAIALDPKAAQTHQWYASTLDNRLEGAECLKQINEALRLSPTSPAIAVDAAFFQANFGDFDAGVKALQEIEQTQPSLASPSLFLRELDFAIGDYPGYIDQAYRYAAITRAGDDVALAAAVARGWAQAGKAGLLEARARALKMAFDHGTEAGFELGETLLLLGRQKEALPYFEASLNRHHGLLISMSECPWAQGLLSDPGYAALFAQVRGRLHGGDPAHPSIIPVKMRLPF